MRDISTPELCRVLDQDRWVIDQLVSREILIPKNTPAPGKSRMWSFEETMRVAILLELSEWLPLFQGRKRKPDRKRTPAEYYAAAAAASLTPAESVLNYLSTQSLHSFTDEPAYLVIARPLKTGLIQTSKIGEPLPPLEIGALPEIDIVRERELAAKVASHPAAIVVALDALEARLRTLWPQDGA